MSNIIKPEVKVIQLVSHLNRLLLCVLNDLFDLLIPVILLKVLRIVFHWLEFLEGVNILLENQYLVSVFYRQGVEFGSKYTFFIIDLTAFVDIFVCIWMQIHGLEEHLSPQIWQDVYLPDFELAHLILGRRFVFLIILLQFIC